MLVVMCLMVGVPTQQIKADWTVAELIADFRSDIAEPDSTTINGGTRFTNAQVRRLLTRGQQLVAQIIGGVEADTAIVLSKSVPHYALPVTAYSVRSCKFINNFDYVLMTQVPHELLGVMLEVQGQQVGPSTQPLFWSVFNQTVWIAPSDLVGNGDTLKVSFRRWPGDLDSNAQVPQLPEYAGEFITEAAVFNAHKRDLTLAEQDAWLVNFRERVDAVVMTHKEPPATVKQQQQPEEVTQ